MLRGLGAALRLQHGDSWRFECVGSFAKAFDGTWSASVTAAYDPETDGDARQVIEGASRMDAIAALWCERHNAYTHHRV